MDDMRITALRTRSPEEICAAVSNFPSRYIEDWECWLSVGDEHRWQLFGKILRKWQATRPKPMRRLQEEATHAPPYLDDLVRRAQTPLAAIECLTVRNIL